MRAAGTLYLCMLMSLSNFVSFPILLEMLHLIIPAFIFHAPISRRNGIREHVPVTARNTSNKLRAGHRLIESNDNTEMFRLFARAMVRFYNAGT